MTTPAGAVSDNYGTKRCRRALEDAMAVTGGMRVGMPKMTVDANHLSHCLAQLDALKQQLAEMRETNAKLEKRIRGYESWERSVSEALNSGDGSYRP